MFKSTVISERLELGEGPHYHAKSQSLYFVDIKSAAILRYCLKSNNTFKATLDGKDVSFIVPVDQTDDKFVVGIDRNVALVTWDGKSSFAENIKYLCEVDNDITSNRLNDGKCDRYGRLWTGTMSTLLEVSGEGLDKGSLFCVTLDKSGQNIHLKKWANKIGISNGLAWNSSNNRMFYIDSLTKKIRQYDYDVELGTLSNETVIFDFELKGIPGVPDGMCIDQHDKLWIACFNGSRVIRIDPVTSELLQTVPIPVKQVTSVAFGGPRLDTLFVTTARIPMKDVVHPDNAGCLFKIEGLNIPGVLPNTFHRDVLKL